LSAAACKQYTLTRSKPLAYGNIPRQANDTLRL